MDTKEMYSTFNAIVKNKVCLDFNKNFSGRLLFKEKLNYCLDHLKEEYREIINNSFLIACYQFWWLDKYSESAYYRKRFRAISSFVFLFKTFDENFN